MSRLYVAGDSFASLSKNQEIGVSWSELLAKELCCELVNISRPGASNESICIQLDWITKRVTDNDFVIILLTDSFRKTLVLPGSDISSKHLLNYHSLHKEQKYLGEDIFSDDPLINVYTHNNANTEYSKYFFKNMYNYTYQKYLDTTLITGSLTKLKSITDNFLVVSNGFNDEIYSSPCQVTFDLFCINKSQFLDLSSSKMLKLGIDSKSYNHLSYDGHKKVFRLIYKSIAEWRRGISTGS
jgi:hypothetical protein